MLGKGTWSTTSAAATGVSWPRRRVVRRGGRRRARRRARETRDGGRGGLAGARIDSGRRARRAAGPRHENLPLPRAVRSENDRAAARRPAERHRRRLHLRRAGLGPLDRRVAVSAAYRSICTGAASCSRCGACQLTLGGRGQIHVAWTARHGSKGSRIREDAGDFIFRWPSKSKKGVLVVAGDFERWTFDEPLVDEGIARRTSRPCYTRGGSDQTAVVLDLELQHEASARRRRCSRL